MNSKILSQSRYYVVFIERKHATGIEYEYLTGSWEFETGLMNAERFYRESDAIAEIATISNKVLIEGKTPNYKIGFAVTSMQEAENV